MVKLDSGISSVLEQPELMKLSSPNSPKMRYLELHKVEERHFIDGAFLRRMGNFIKLIGQDGIRGGLKG